MQPTILIVDDEKHTRDGLRRLLEDEYDVYIAEDIGGAMSVLERETVDLLLTDLRLAGEDGMQLIERALKMPHPPICIMMTAYGSVDTAVEAMKRRGILRIRTDMDESHVRVSFIDTGGGMSAETLSHVFEPYYTTKERGTGLGLLIVRRIVREHGGELAIESTEGKGLTLTIRLPFKEQRVRMLEAGDRVPGDAETRELI